MSLPGTLFGPIKSALSIKWNRFLWNFVKFYFIGPGSGKIHQIQGWELLMGISSESLIFCERKSDVSESITVALL